jgi:ethanolamine utilization protein EutM
MNNKALGFFEVKSLVAAIWAADIMVKSASVVIKDFNRVGSGLIAVVVEGDVAAVNAAVDAAKLEAGSMPAVLGTLVIPRPESDMEMLF